MAKKRRLNFWQLILLGFLTTSIKTLAANEGEAFLQCHQENKVARSLLEHGPNYRRIIGTLLGAKPTGTLDLDIKTIAHTVDKRPDRLPRGLDLIKVRELLVELGQRLEEAEYQHDPEYQSCAQALDPNEIDLLDQAYFSAFVPDKLQFRVKSGKIRTVPIYLSEDEDPALNILKQDYWDHQNRIQITEVLRKIDRVSNNAPIRFAKLMRGISPDFPRSAQGFLEWMGENSPDLDKILTQLLHASSDL